MTINRRHSLKVTAKGAASALPSRRTAGIGRNHSRSGVGMADAERLRRRGRDPDRGAAQHAAHHSGPGTVVPRILGRGSLSRGPSMVARREI
jgi:hypothetical protein